MNKGTQYKLKCFGIHFCKFVLFLPLLNFFFCFFFFHFNFYFVERNFSCRNCNAILFEVQVLHTTFTFVRLYYRLNFSFSVSVVKICRKTVHISFQYYFFFFCVFHFIRKGKVGVTTFCDGKFLFFFFCNFFVSLHSNWKCFHVFLSILNLENRCFAYAFQFETPEMR